MNTDRFYGENWTPIAEAAQLLGTTPLNVLMHVKRGLLVGAEHEDGWLVDTASLVELVRKHGTGGLTAVCQSGCASKATGCGSCA